MLLTLAALIVVCAGIRAAADIVVPVLAAVFVTTVALPPIIALQRRGAPLWLSATAVLVGVVIALVGAGALGASAVAQFTADLPTYTAKLDGRFAEFSASVKQYAGADIGSMVSGMLNPSQIMGLLGSAIGALVAMLRDGVFVLMTTAFLVAEAAGMPAKLRAAFGLQGEAMRPWTGVLNDMTTYLYVKSATSLLTAVLVAATLAIAGVPFALALGALAFLLNFVPVFGAILAGVPAILLALVLHGVGSAAVVAAVYTGINVLIGSVVEPRWMGQKLGLSTLVVFLSLVFWGFLLGPIGMLLAVPLTMLAKILLDHTRDLRWLAILLGPTPRDVSP
jgi:predicted PurR-regulated permease PerM